MGRKESNQANKIKVILNETPKDMFKGDGNIENKWIWNASFYYNMQSATNLIKIE